MRIDRKELEKLRDVQRDLDRIAQNIKNSYDGIQDDAAFIVIDDSQTDIVLDVGVIGRTLDAIEERSKK